MHPKQHLDGFLTAFGKAEELGLVAYCKEPEYSLSVLVDLERTHGVPTWAVRRGLVALDKETEAEWLFNWEVFTQAGGTVGALLGAQFLNHYLSVDKPLGLRSDGVSGLVFPEPAYSDAA